MVQTVIVSKPLSMNYDIWKVLYDDLVKSICVFIINHI